MATSGNGRTWTKVPNSGHIIQEAKRRGLNCGIISNEINMYVKNTTKNTSFTYASGDNIKMWDDSHLCSMATSGSGTSWTRVPNSGHIIKEAKRRGLDCGIRQVSTNGKTRVLKKFFAEMDDNRLCANFKHLKDLGNLVGKKENHKVILNEISLRGLNCGVKETKNTFASIYKKSKKQILNDIAKETKNQISQNIIILNQKLLIQ